MVLGEKIKDLRLTCGLTQEELADRCELSKGYISQIENDLTSPSIATLVDLLAALGTNLKEFSPARTTTKRSFTQRTNSLKSRGRATRSTGWCPTRRKT